MARKNKMSLWQKLRYKYRVSIVNEDYEEEERTFYASRLGVLFWGMLISAILILTGSLLVILTPIHKKLPGYTEEDFREQIIRSNVMVDSLANVVRMQDQFIRNLQQVMTGDVPVDTMALNDSILYVEREEVLPTSETEMEFRENYEKRKTVK